jgi:phosphatidylglycerophosphate synthase
VHQVHRGPIAGLVGVVALLAVLEPVADLGATGWLVGAGCGVGLAVVLHRALTRQPRAGRTTALGPADEVTLVRAALVCGVAGLAAGGGLLPVLIGLAVVALVLDGVDGQVARRTGTSSDLGARFDLEVDAFLILVLSVLVAGTAGSWVLLIGLARYLFVAAGRLLPWLRGSAPPRPWCKVVAVVQGVTLTVVAADVLPLPWARLALAVALVLLAESFGRESWELWQIRAGTGQASQEKEPARV